MTAKKRTKKRDGRAKLLLWGARDGVVMKALASHQCGPGSDPGVDAIFGSSLLWVISFVPRGFAPRTPVFPSPQKPTFSNSNSTRNQVDEEPLCGCATSKSLLFIFFQCKPIAFWQFSLTSPSSLLKFPSLSSLNVPCVNSRRGARRDVCIRRMFMTLWIQ